MKRILAGATTLLSVAISLSLTAAPGSAQQAPVPRPVQPPTPRAPKIDYGPYMNELESRIRSHWKEPSNLHTKRVVVVFKVHKNGTLSNLHVTETSGIALLDRAALEALKDSAPFQGLPAGTASDVNCQFTFFPEHLDVAAEIHRCDLAISADKKNASTYTERADAYERLNKHSQAIADCTQAISLSPGLQQAYCTRGHAYSQLGEEQKALDDLNKAISLDPMLGKAYRYRALVHQAHRRDKEAIADFNQAVRLEPDIGFDFFSRGVSYTHLNEHQKAIEDYSKSIKLGAKAEHSYFDRAVEFAALGQYLPAIADYSQSIILAPKDYKAFTNRGQSYFCLGQNQKALTDWNKSIELAPREAIGYYNRACVYERLRANKQAIDDLSKAIALDPRYINSYIVRARIYLNGSQRWKAIADYSEAISLGSGSESYRNRAFAYLGLGQYQKAIDDLSKAAQLDPKNAAIFRERADVFAKFEKFEDAMRDYSQAYDLDPSYGVAAAGSSSDLQWGGEPIKCGYVDKSGQTVIKPQFDQAGKFSEGLASVRLGSRFGFIDRSGNMVIKPQFAETGEFHEGLAAAVTSAGGAGPAEGPTVAIRTVGGARLIDDNSWVFIDKSGQFVIKPNSQEDAFESDSRFSEGLLAERVGRRSGFIDKSGQMMIKPMFDAALPFCEGLAGVQIGNKFGFIDKSGKLVIKPQFLLVGNFSDGRAAALIPGAPAPVPEGHTPAHSPESDWLAGSKYGFIDKTGTFAIKPEYTLPANSGQRFLTGFMCSDSSGGTCIAARVHPESFDALVSFSEGLAPMQRGAKFGFIDTNGAMVIEAKFDAVSPFSDGLSFVKSGGHSWFIDKKGQTALKPNAPVCEFSEGLAAVEIDAPKKIVQPKSKRK